MYVCWGTDSERADESEDDVFDVLQILIAFFFSIGLQVELRATDRTTMVPWRRDQDVESFEGWAVRQGEDKLGDVLLCVEGVGSALQQALWGCFRWRTASAWGKKL